MLIVCPTCVSAYRVDPEIMRLSQGSVRCAHCRRIWAPGEGRAGRLDPRGDPPKAFADLDGARMSSIHLASASPASIPRGRARSDVVALGTMAALVAAAMLGLGLRRPIVQAAPEVAPLYALIGLPTTPRALQVKDVKTEMVQEGATPVLTLEGTIQNNRADVVHLPTIRIVVRDGAEQSLYTWTAAAPKPTLAPGETVAFRSRLVAPPGNGHDVQVGFTDAHVATSEAVVKGTK